MNFSNYSIRLLAKNDSKAFFHLIEMNRSRLGFFAGTISKNKSLEETQLYLIEVMERMAAKTYFPYVIIDNTTNAMAGFIDVKNIDWNIPKAELGCFMDEGFLKKGIAHQALNLVIQHLFAELGFQKLFLRTHKENTSARKLAESCGFELEGTIRKDYKTSSGELVDLLYYGNINAPRK